MIFHFLLDLSPLNIFFNHCSLIKLRTKINSEIPNIKAHIKSTNRVNVECLNEKILIRKISSSLIIKSILFF